MILAGRNAVVTGANRGIGAAILAEFAAQGANVWACARRAESDFLEMCAQLAQEHGVWIEPVIFDIADEDGIKAGAQQIRIEKKPVDILVNNAGITRDGLLMRMKDEDFDAVIDINLKGVYLVTKAVSKIMMKQRSGHIINMTSVVGVMGNAGQTNYAASKAGVIGFTKSCAKELASRGITVNAIAPGFINTDMTDVLPEKVKEAMVTEIPLGRMADAEEVATVATFLASDFANYITGQVINVDGGMLT